MRTNLDDFYTRIGAAGKIKFFDRLLFSIRKAARRDASRVLARAFHLTASFRPSRADAPGQALHRARDARYSAHQG